MSALSLVEFLFWQLAGLFVLGLIVAGIHKILTRLFPDSEWL